MPWLSILKGLISLASSVAAYMRDKKLMDAGAADAVLKGLQNARKEATLAISAGNVVSGDPGSVHDPFQEK